MKKQHFVALATAMALLAGCSTRYVPQTPGRVSIVMQDGSLAYQRDGQAFPHGFVGNGLINAVNGDPEATEAAETYVGRNIGGFAATMIGSACLLGSAIALSPERRTDSRVAASLGMLFCALGGYVTGGVLYQSAVPYQLDAINIFNDR